MASPAGPRTNGNDMALGSPSVPNRDPVPMTRHPSDLKDTAAAPFDPMIFRRYLEAILPPVMGADLDELHTLFDDEDDFEEKIVKFASESGMVVIYVTKVRDEVVTEEGKSYRSYVHHRV
ncbi:hypothetical protein FISHEDRAFT_72428 [Fistulina hepatica ATCC 64428]|uniref:Uncharacterized protein n=1 Tax=Fistulina hepatica ATCC 64428 TaxID=1128425 RepID=A0A0D7AEL2_9AGAR|nr:hypothetical protein FISHEDRAFT_72428 [Fistulina hepatica ATCC 64428]